MRFRWTLVAAVAMVGVTVGVVTAVAIPTAESTSSDPPLSALAGPISTKPALRRLPGQVALRPHRGTVREELRRVDPAGGPDWVLRSMRADLLIDPRFRRPGRSTMVGSGVCLQLLRDVGGKLGWVDGDNVFRPVSVRENNGMTQCAAGNSDGSRRRAQPFRAETLLARPSSSHAALRGQVVWGFTGPAVQRIRVRAGGEVRSPHLSPRWGAFLEFYGPRRPVGDVSFRLRYSDGKIVDTGRGEPARTTSSRESHRPLSLVIARAPDPAGGPSWGLVGNRSKSGRWCVGDPGHLLGDVVGWIDPRYGRLQAVSGDFTRSCSADEQPTRKMPVMARTSYRGLVDEGSLAPTAGQLRLQRGRSLIFGRTHEDVVSLTISTPRDVRTVTPIAPGRGFLVVYDGEFGGGRLVATAHFRDGHTQDVELPGSGF